MVEDHHTLRDVLRDRSIGRLRILLCAIERGSMKPATTSRSTRNETELFPALTPPVSHAAQPGQSTLTVSHQWAPTDSGLQHTHEPQCLQCTQQLFHCAKQRPHCFLTITSHHVSASQDYSTLDKYISSVTKCASKISFLLFLKSCGFGWTCTDALMTREVRTTIAGGYEQPKVGSKRRSSERAVHAFNHRAISLVSVKLFNF